MRYFKIVHFLSLDVVFGAVAMNDVLYQYFLGSLPPWQFDLILAISVYLIYGIDRQIDNYTSETRDELHAYHEKHQVVLRRIIIVLGIYLGMLLMWVEFPMIKFGIGLGIAILLYWLGWVKHVFERFWGFKELLTAGIYSLGVALPTMVIAPYSNILVAFVLEIFLLALMNLSLYTLIEEGGSTRVWMTCCILTFLFMIALGIIGVSLSLLSLFLFIWGIHVGIYYFRASKPERYVGDLAFLSPLIYLLCLY
ncbi:MAG: hypothetical protein RL638_2317 [Bacteroidota bacterium]|jgi:hypothetical protein